MRVKRRRRATFTSDVTARRQAEQALLQSESHYRFLAENATDLISRHAPDGTYLYASPACRELLGYTAEELLHAGPYVRFHPDDEPALRASHRAMIDGQDH